MSRSFFFQTLLELEHVFFAARLIDLHWTLITEATPLEEPVIGSSLLVDDAVPALKRPPEPVHVPVRAGLPTEEVPGAVAVQLRAKILDLLSGELATIAAGSFVKQPIEALAPIEAAPVEEARARAASDVKDLIQLIADAVEAHGLKARTRRAVLFLEEDALKLGGLFVIESKLSGSHTSR